MKATLATAEKKMAPGETRGMTVKDKVKILAMHLDGKSPAEIARVMGFDSEWCEIVANTFSSDREFKDLAAKLRSGVALADGLEVAEGLGSARRG